MRKILFYCLVAGITINYVSCNVNNTENGNVISNVNCSDFNDKITEDVILLDVRSKSEFNEGHIKGALNIDVMDDNFESNIATLDKEKTVLVYCRSGSRSANAAKILERLGFKKIFDLEGGITFWQEEGFPVE